MKLYYKEFCIQIVSVNKLGVKKEKKNQMIGYRKSDFIICIKPITISKL